MRENLVLDLREAADKWRANHPAVMTFEIRYDLALCEAANAIEELQGRAKVLEKVADKWCEAVPKWIPVTERLPEHEYGESTSVLTVDLFGVMRVTYFDGGNWCWPSGEALTTLRVAPITLWMPLPEPPKEETHDNN